MAAAEEIDVNDLLAGKKEKIKELMRRDPKFIARLISQLDRQMHKMMLEKHKRSEEIKADQTAVDRIDETIRVHIQPSLARLIADINDKQQLRERVSQQLESDLTKFKEMEREAAALISRARHANSKLMGKTAQAALQEARGFTATVPTTQLIRAKARSTAAGNSSSANGATSATQKKK